MTTLQKTTLIDIGVLITRTPLMIFNHKSLKVPVLTGTIVLSVQTLATGGNIQSLGERFKEL